MKEIDGDIQYVTRNLCVSVVYCIICVLDKSEHVRTALLPRPAGHSVGIVSIAQSGVTSAYDVGHALEVGSAVSPWHLAEATVALVRRGRRGTPLSQCGTTAHLR